MHRGFQKLAKGEITPAKLIGWGARVLYLGPAFGLTPHRNATGVLAVDLDGPLGVADDPAGCTTTYRAARSVLILPNSLHHLRIERGRMAFLYVDPLGRDLTALTERMTDARPRAAFDLQGEAAVIAVMTDLAENRIAPPEARGRLGELLGVGGRRKINARVAAALRQMRDEPHRAHRLTTLAARAGLSPSRFCICQGRDRGAAAAVPHLEPDGRRRPRLWRGLIPDGGAHTAGFASSAHFSSAFREMLA